MLLFIPSLLAGDMSAFFMRLVIVFILWLVVLVASLVDLKTGIDASKRLGCFKTTSRGLRQTIQKDVQYMNLLFIGFLFDFVLSYLTTLVSIVPLFGIFNIPVFSILGVIGLLIIEGISVRENLDKGKSKVLVSHETIETMIEIASILGDDKVKAISNLIKNNVSKTTLN